MKIAMIVVRTLMGLLFLMASVTFFLGMVEMPPMTGAPKAFNEGLAAVGYFFPMLKATELLCGIAFVVGRFVPLATVIIAPVIINIFMYDIFVDRTMPGPVFGVFLVLANIFVAYYYRAAYAGLLSSK
jgi:putative oxidoreductase